MPKGEIPQGQGDHQNKSSEVRLMGPYPAIAAAARATAEASKPPVQPKPESEIAKKLKEKKEPSLGDRNPLLEAPDLMSKEAVDALELISIRKIEKYGGVMPDSFHVALIPDAMGQLWPRLVVQFKTEDLSEEKIALLEGLTEKMYEGKEVRTRKSPSDKALSPSVYPSTDTTGKIKGEEARLLGWYMGYQPPPESPLSTGLLVHKDVGDKGLVGFFKDKPVKDWFYSNDLVDPMTGKKLKTRYNVEIRESSLYQTDIVEYVTQVSTILGRGEMLPRGPLTYEIYNDLNRLGLKKNGAVIHGLDSQIDRIDRSIILPLANLDLSSGINLKANSVLLIGVPGTGKTAVIEKKLQQDTGVFIVPLDPKKLVEDIYQPPYRQRILPRIEQVFARTGIPVVLHCDDLENIAAYKDINSSLLNLMAGVRERGFFLIGSTNYPERLDPQLLQPQRFGDVIYFGLHDKEARKNILDKHATATSLELQKPLFASEEQREQVLEVIAVLTDNYTPRFLAEICKEAKSFYLQRIATLREKRKGLAEEHIQDERFSLEDWNNGYHAVAKKYNKQETVERDKELQIFAKKYDRSLGFAPETKKSQPRNIFESQNLKPN